MLNLLARIRSSSASTKLAAIESVQGWVEFAPTGHIIAISDKLCETLGYTKNEVLGQHHRVLCDPELLASAEYGAFWERLRAGTADAGCYPRLRKDGTEVWLQASYTPVRRLGRVVRIIKFATDVTADRRRSSASTSHLAAMNHSQAIIEFALDGTVHEANANFLSAMGYRAEEIVGRHHRIFCDPDYANSSAYGEFWQRLGAGETFSGRYPRRRKDGSTIWIQGAYNPLRDARGRVIGVVKACIDVTEQVESERALETLVREAGDVLSAMARGDLTGRVNGQYRGELAHLASSLNQAADALTRTLLEVGVVARSLDISVGQLAEGTVDLSARTSAQVSSLEETAAAMEEMTASVRRNAEHAKAAETVGQQTRHAAQESGQLMAEATLAMTAISESAKRIGAITRVIDELAFQTNLLSLNAAIEAARAGEHGQGFAVVADEVRRLALRSATASREISTLVEDTMQRVADGGRLVNDTASALHGIVTSVEHVTTFVEQICVAAQEQSAGIAQVNGSVSSMDMANQQNAALAEELSAASLSLQQQANALRDQVTAFVLEKEQPAGDTRRHEAAAPPTGRAPSASRRSARREVFAAT